ncbi:MAG: PASTA domain-containing protein [Chloroflexi bacterium]|nr:PASTA domain-containing protein [Chloroflexota bacterium]
MKGKSSRAFVILLAVIFLALAGYYFFAHPDIVIPDLTGRTFADAQSALEMKGLRMDVEKTVSGNLNKESKVISQFPPAGLTLRKGQVVHLYFGGEPPVEVPRLVQSLQGEAERILAGIGLVVKIQEKEQPGSPFRQVLEQSPTAGTNVQPASVITLVVNKTRGHSQMPSLIGLTIREAGDLTSNSGLKLTSGSAPSARYPSGIVISQDPPAGSILSDNANVHVTLSEGMEGLVYPDLEGKSIKEARAILQPIGLGLQVQEENAGDNCQVTRQEPAAGSPVRDTEIKIWCTSTLVMPVLLGKSLEEAKAVLKENGFSEPSVKFIENPAPAGTVLEQDPGHGLEVDAGSGVELLVSGAPGKDKH